MPAGALPYQSDGDIIFYRARKATASVSPEARVWAFLGARTIHFSGMAGSVVHLLEQPRPGCDRVLPHSREPGRGAGRANRDLTLHERVRGECNAKKLRSGIGSQEPPDKQHGRAGLTSVKDSARQHRERPGSSRERPEPPYYAFGSNRHRAET